MRVHSPEARPRSRVQLPGARSQRRAAAASLEPHLFPDEERGRRHLRGLALDSRDRPVGLGGEDSEGDAGAQLPVFPPVRGGSHLARRRAEATARGWVAPTTAPTDESPTSPTSSSPPSATSDATWCQSGRPSVSCKSWTSPPAFDVLTRTKIPVPLRRAAAMNGSTDSRPR